MQIFISILILQILYFIPTLILLHYNRNDKLALIAAIFPIKGSNYSHTGKIIFPAWEQNIPTLGTYFDLMAQKLTTTAYRFSRDMVVF